MDKAELIVKAKCVDDGEYKTGYFVGRNHIVMFGNWGCFQGMITGPIELMGFSAYRVDPDTLCRPTEEEMKKIREALADDDKYEEDEE